MHCFSPPLVATTSPSAGGTVPWVVDEGVAPASAAVESTEEARSPASGALSLPRASVDAVTGTRRRRPAP